MKVIFFDTETTGKEVEDRIIQLAFQERNFKGIFEVDDNVMCVWAKPPLPIKIEAMAVHHITEAKVAAEPLFKDSLSYDSLKTLFASGDHYAVAHNAEFDQKMLAKEDITISNVICTLKVARYLDKDGKIPSHSLQYLRYFLKLDIEADAHDARGDVLVLAAIFDRLYSAMRDLPKFEDNQDAQAVLREMVRISEEPSVIPRFGFGKYKGQMIADIAKSDRDYLRWLRDSESKKGAEADKDMLHTLALYL